MRRRYLHVIFMIVGAGFLIAVIWQWAVIRKSETVVSALDAMPIQLSTRDEHAIPEKASHSSHVQLALANALSKGNNLEQAELAYSNIIRMHEFDALGQAAQFNLANAYLRQGMRSASSTTKSRSMLELAKQRYRDLLRKVPSHWDARYNLERTLLLAPESTDASSDDKNEPVKRVRVIVPGFEKQDLP